MYFTFATSYLVHVLLFLALASLAKGHYGDTDAPDVTWELPASGDTYSPGDTMNAQWKSDKEIVSPSFKLCQSSGNAHRRTYSEANDRVPALAGRDDACGISIWPVVKQTDDGSYRASV